MHFSVKDNHVSRIAIKMHTAESGGIAESAAGFIM